MEIEAGLGAANNADDRDIVRTTLILDADDVVLEMLLSYRFESGCKQLTPRAYETTRSRREAVSASARLKLPSLEVLLVGY